MFSTNSQSLKTLLFKMMTFPCELMMQEFVKQNYGCISIPGKQEVSLNSVVDPGFRV